MSLAHVEAWCRKYEPSDRVIMSASLPAAVDAISAHNISDLTYGKALMLPDPVRHFAYIREIFEEAGVGNDFKNITFANSQEIWNLLEEHWRIIGTFYGRSPHVIALDSPQVLHHEMSDSRFVNFSGLVTLKGDLLVKNVTFAIAVHQFKKLGNHAIAFALPPVLH